MNKDIWSKQNFKSHSARLSTCQDILDLEICEEIKEDNPMITLIQELDKPLLLGTGGKPYCIKRNLSDCLRNKFDE